MGQFSSPPLPRWAVGCSFGASEKGFFPIQDTGFLIGPVAGVCLGSHPDQMKKLQQQLIARRRKRTPGPYRGVVGNRRGTPRAPTRASFMQRSSLFNERKRERNGYRPPPSS